MLGLILYEEEGLTFDTSCGSVKVLTIEQVLKEHGLIYVKYLKCLPELGEFMQG
jgi:hypothetical protein